MTAGLFTRDDIARLEAAYPDRDVRRLAAKVEAKHRARGFRHPGAVLEAYLRRAEQNDTDRREAHATPANEYRPAPLGERSDPTYAAFRFAVLERVLAGASPDQVAELLAEHQPKFAHLPHNGVEGGLGELIDQEIELDRSMLGHWRHVDWAKHMHDFAPSSTGEIEAHESAFAEALS